MNTSNDIITAFDGYIHYSNDFIAAVAQHHKKFIF